MADTPAAARTPPGDPIPGWEIVARRTHAPLTHLLFIALQALMDVPPVSRSPVTFTLRSRDSGEVRAVTAYSIEEAALLAGRGEFDGG